MRWRVASRAPLLWRHWDAEWVVFQPDSGDTHLVDPVAASVLRRLESAPASSADLTEELAHLPFPDPVGDHAETVTRLLRAFDGVGLIEPVDDPA